MAERGERVSCSEKAAIGGRGGEPRPRKLNFAIPAVVEGREGETDAWRGGC